MRNTADLPDDLHQAGTSIAPHSRRSMNQTVAELIRCRLLLPSAAHEATAETALRVDTLTGLPLIRSPRPVMSDDLRALEAE